MTYEGLGSILFRFVGVVLVGASLILMVPSIALGPAYLQDQLTLLLGFLLLPGAILIIASKPLGKVVAAGLG